MQAAAAGAPLSPLLWQCLSFYRKVPVTQQAEFLGSFLFYLKAFGFPCQQLLHFRYLNPLPIHAVGQSISSVTSFPCYPRDGCPGFSKQGYNRLQLGFVFLCLRHVLTQVKMYPLTLKELSPDVSSQHQQNTKSFRWQKGTVTPVCRRACRHRSKGSQFL